FRRQAEPVLGKRLLVLFAEEERCFTHGIDEMHLRARRCGLLQQRTESLPQVIVACELWFGAEVQLDVCQCGLVVLEGRRFQDASDFNDVAGPAARAVYPDAGLDVEPVQRILFPGSVFADDLADDVELSALSGGEGPLVADVTGGVVALVSRT